MLCFQQARMLYYLNCRMCFVWITWTTHLRINIHLQWKWAGAHLSVPTTRQHAARLSACRSEWKCDHTWSKKVTLKCIGRPERGVYALLILVHSHLRSGGETSARGASLTWHTINIQIERHREQAGGKMTWIIVGAQRFLVWRHLGSNEKKRVWLAE